MKDKVLEKLSRWWNSLLPKQRKAIALVGVCSGAFIIAVLGWTQSRGKVNPQTSAKKETRKEITMEPGMMEKKRELDNQAEVLRLKEQIEAIKTGKPIDSVGSQFAPAPDDRLAPAGVELSIAKTNVQSAGESQIVGRPGQQVPAGNNSAIQQPVQQGAQQQGRGGNKQQLAGLSLPPLPPTSSNGNVKVPPPPLPPGSSTLSDGVAPVPYDPPGQEMGEISIVSYEPGKNGSSDKGKKKGMATTSVYLPPSYMEATLLSGAYIPTTESAKGNPMPVLLRVKTPAFLPNEAKAAVKGCYIIADGKANLATERAEMTVVSLSCLDRKGQAVIDQKVKGWLIDSDGIAGVGGKVVAKMGAMVARSLVAGFFGGAGEALKATATTTSVSPLGTTQTIDPKDVAMAGVGAGISNGFKEIQKFYLELAKQTMPAIAILPSKSVTVAISEGVMLNIKPINGNGSSKK